MPDPWSDASLVRTFEEVAQDPASLRQFVLGIGDAAAPSRRAIASRLKSLLCGSVLDVGCGPGVFIETLHQHAPSVDYLGIDESPKLCGLALERSGFAPPMGRREVVEAIAGLGGFERRDAVVLRHVLEHVGERWPDVLRWSLSHATRAAFVAVSQPMLRMREAAVESDRYLGVRRWSLPWPVFASIASDAGWRVVEQIRPPNPDVVVREELYVLRPSDLVP